MRDFRNAGPMVATAFVIAGALFLLLWLDIIPDSSLRLDADPTALVWQFLPKAIGLAAFALLAWGVWNGGRAVIVLLQGEPAPRAAFSRHTVAQIQGSIDEYERAAEPNATEIVDYLMHQAVWLQSSDVHLVPYASYTLVRLRIDGILIDVARIQPRSAEVIRNRLKVLSKAVLFLRDRPQDGRFSVQVTGRKVDIRASFMPTLHGERIVMRVLERTEVELGLRQIGFTTSQLETMQRLLERPQGLLLLTGPTGAGKTTTIYCALRVILERTAGSTSVYTLEDPIEYDLANINQTQIEETQGLDFASGLRTLLRQDPDVIMVGEIRDLETGRIALQAGMTGHLIITTVHADRAAGAFMRMTEIGVDAHSLASAVTAVIAQRLVRVLCPHCKRPEPPTPGQMAKVGRSLPAGSYMGPTGCPKCNQKGYSGRRAVFEILELDEVVRAQIVARASTEKIHAAAIAAGMSDLLASALGMAERGETSLDEVLRVVPTSEATR